MLRLRGGCYRSLLLVALVPIISVSVFRGSPGICVVAVLLRDSSGWMPVWSARAAPSAVLGWAGLVSAFSFCSSDRPGAANRVRCGPEARARGC